MRRLMNAVRGLKDNPMILGIGTDLYDIRRIEVVLDRFGDRLAQRILTPDEQKRVFRRSNPAGGLAQRFAAKEACAKALGTGFGHGVFWRDLAIDNLPTGGRYRAPPEAP